MKITSFSSQEFSQNALTAMGASKDGPVFITDGNTPTHVLLTYTEYQRLCGQQGNIARRLASPDVADVEFDPPRIHIGVRPTDFTGTTPNLVKPLGACMPF